MCIGKRFLLLTIQCSDTKNCTMGIRVPDLMFLLLNLDLRSSNSKDYL